MSYLYKISIVSTKIELKCVVLVHIEVSIKTNTVIVLCSTFTNTICISILSQPLNLGIPLLADFVIFTT